MAADNRLLGEFNLEGIPPQPRGMPKIEVKFDIDQNGILNVHAKDVTTGKEASIQVKHSAGLSESEINRMQKMQKDAESHASEDKKRLELATARNEAEHLCFQLEKLMKDHEDKLSEADKAPLTRSIATVREAAKGNDVQSIKSAVNDLEQAQQAFSKVLYERSQTAPGAAPQGATGGDDDTIDAEFEVKKD
jgi:molecular chaperone DnaK